MKLSLDNRYETGEAEARRQSEIRRRNAREARARRWAQFRASLFRIVRTVIIFALFTSGVTAAVVYRNEISSAATKEIRRIEAGIQSRPLGDSLRQAALNHEKESESPLDR